MSFSLRTRLLLVFLGGMVVSAGLVTAAVLLSLNAFSEYLLRSGIEDYAEAAASRIAFDQSGIPIGIDKSNVGAWIFSGLGKEIVLRVLDDSGAVVYPPDGVNDALATAPGHFDPRIRVFSLSRDGIAMHAATVGVDHGGRRWYVQLAASDRLVLQMRRSVGLTALETGLAATCALFLVISLVTTHLTLRVTLAPLRIASSEAEGISPTTLDARLDAASQPPEIRPLVSAFNRALDRLQQGFHAQQEFLAAVAHELKTPLALVRAEIERAPSLERRAVVLRDVDQMARQVQQLLMLAEVSEPQSFSLVEIDPRVAAREAFDFMARYAERRDVHMAIRFENPLERLTADRGALFTLLKNLLENAVQHSPAGSVVTLNLNAGGFTVIDEGCGVPQADLPYLFERFWRGRERQHNGAGLGLAICNQIAVAHGWRLSVENSGKGLTVSIGCV